ncbi:MAG: hypothetical protein O7A62_08740 [Alphaproteobacteria bacterium]|nr:hypothetical protein [Alphaproteobacteria bacterium]MCZ6590401.1 hypothetical protein [Alphaproteobacteria bacterium]MCZ6861661.1 hypothetical protein [Alphaproteobacteria bacterium]
MEYFDLIRTCPRTSKRVGVCLLGMFALVLVFSLAPLADVALAQSATEDDNNTPPPPKSGTFLWALLAVECLGDVAGEAKEFLDEARRRNIVPQYSLAWCLENKFLPGSVVLGGEKI